MCSSVLAYCLLLTKCNARGFRCTLRSASIILSLPCEFLRKQFSTLSLGTSMFQLAVSKKRILIWSLYVRSSQYCTALASTSFNLLVLRKPFDWTAPTRGLSVCLLKVKLPIHIWKKNLKSRCKCTWRYSLISLSVPANITPLHCIVKMRVAGFYGQQLRHHTQVTIDTVTW